MPNHQLGNYPRNAPRGHAHAHAHSHAAHAHAPQHAHHGNPQVAPLSSAPAHVRNAEMVPVSQPQQPQQQPHMLMGYYQNPDGTWFAAPYNPQLGQTGGGGWLSRLAVVGALGVAGWWAYKKLIASDMTRKFAHEPREESVSHRRSGFYRNFEGTGGRRRHLDEQRRSRGKARVVAELKRLLDSAETDDDDGDESSSNDE